MRAVVAVALAASLGLAACAAPSTLDACRVTPVAAVKLDVADARPLLDVTVNGRPARLLLDTGASSTVIGTAAAARLGVPIDPNRRFEATALGAETQGWRTPPVALSLGGHALAPASVAVTDLGATWPPAYRIDGLLGRASLAAYDVDIDMPERRMVLNEPRSCAAPPFGGPSVSFDIPPNPGQHMIIPMTIDGVGIAALVDTGANRTVVDASRLGLSATALGSDEALPIYTADPAGATFRIHRFQRIQIARDVLRNVKLPVGRVPPLGFDAVLGSDYWRGRRVWLSFAGWTVTVGEPGAHP